MIGLFIGAILFTVLVFAFCIYLEERTEHANLEIFFLFIGVALAFLAIITLVLSLNEFSRNDEYKQTWCTSQEGAVYGGGGCFRDGKKIEMPKEMEK